MQEQLTEVYLVDEHVNLVDELKELSKIKDSLLQLKGSFDRLGINNEEYSLNLVSYQLDYLERIIENNRVCSTFKFYKKEYLGFKLCGISLRKQHSAY